MEFKDNEAIYLQIAGYMSDHILLGKWAGDEKIPSVRELAGDLQVNPNTVMRTYDLLQQQEVIYNKRGLGFFVAPEAAQQVKALRKERFLQQELPEFFKTVSLLDISLEEVQERYTRFQQEQTATLPS
ncbi:MULTISPECIES: GntR family transcriptional regulator [Hymenobacter]|uniref:GntR family transcriptional regulator n=1 Tax=Hymenobacter profundi TaxID=1982110 RepID=A0ABS6WY00_9BACT|nr:MULTISPECIES: GntR family transcriptional regulator [Hymenobacter]MBW3127648.1 GntR family transcriptional regulator [Hymenobacter profundi]QNE38231.1 GntR family transcriptional regulator [Hymenobacter sp. NBH84]